MIYDRIKALCKAKGITVAKLEQDLELGRSSIRKMDKHDLSEAKQMLKDAEYEDGYIAVIENDVCVDELTQEELFEKVR